MRIWVDCPFLFLFYKFFFLAVVVYHTGQSSTYTMKLAELSSELFVAQRGGGESESGEICSRFYYLFI